MEGSNATLESGELNQLRVEAERQKLLDVEAKFAMERKRSSTNLADGAISATSGDTRPPWASVVLRRVSSRSFSTSATEPPSVTRAASTSALPDSPRSSEPTPTREADLYKRTRERPRKGPQHFSKFESTKQTNLNLAQKMQQQQPRERPKTTIIPSSPVANGGIASTVESEMIASKATNGFDFPGQKLGIEVWRFSLEKTTENSTEHEQLFVVSDSAHGIFRESDCYFVLQNCIQSVDQSNLLHKVFLWIGKTTTLADSAKSRIQELLAKLSVTEYVTLLQGEETSEFKKLFKSLRYVQPKALRRQVGHRHEKRITKLYQLGGTKNFILKRVAVSPSSLNQNDVFILDDDMHIYQWSGSASHRMKVGKALDLVTRLRDESMTRCKADIHIFDKSQPGSDKFWEALGGRPNELDNFTVEQLAQWETDTLRSYILYKVNGDQCDRVDDVCCKGEILLGAEECFVFDCVNDIFAWYGKLSQQGKRQTAYNFARSLLKGRQQNGQANGAVGQKCLQPEVLVVHQGAEGVVFNNLIKSKFKFTPHNPTEFIDSPDRYKKRLSTVVSPNKGVAMNIVAKKVNVDRFIHPELYKIASEDTIQVIPSSLPTDNATTSIWRVKDIVRISVDKEEFGIFFTSNCYVILYAYSLVVTDENNKITHTDKKELVFFWQGAFASVEDRAASALLAKELVEEAKERRTVTRVEQGREPSHFLSIFTNFSHAFLILNGNRNELKTEELTRELLIEVREVNESHAKGFQTEAKCCSLYFRSSFILFKNNATYLWHGKSSTELQRIKSRLFAEKFLTFVSYTSAGFDEHAIAVKSIGRITEFTQGQERSGFWDAIGGRGGYLSQGLSASKKPTRMFHCSEGTGVFGVNEVDSPTAADFISDDVFIVDTYDEVYAWIGSKANNNKIEQSIVFAKEYVALCVDGREKCPIYTVKEDKGAPLQFIAQFHGWHCFPLTKKCKILLDNSMLDKIEVETQVQSMNKKRQSMEVKENLSKPTNGSLPASDAKRSNNNQSAGEEYVPYDYLKERPLPSQYSHLDLTKLESYLSPEEFLKVFKMDREKWDKLPAWRRLALKKEKKLF